LFGEDTEPPHRYQRFALKTTIAFFIPAGPVCLTEMSNPAKWACCASPSGQHLRS
jgi:hypothetical protein